MRNFNVIILIGPIQNGVRRVFPGGRSFGKSLFYGGPLCLQLVTSNRKPEKTITMQIFDGLF